MSHSLLSVVCLALSAVALRIQSSPNDLVASNNIFAHNLSATLYRDESTRHNIWISPLSISSCFALIYAATTGQTKQQIGNTMHFPLDIDKAELLETSFLLQSQIETTYDGARLRRNEWDSKASVIKMVDRVYISDTLSVRPLYLSILNNTNDSASRLVPNFDFSAQNATESINNWAHENTHGFIHDIIPETMDISSWKLAALNAIYFNGSFQHPFDATMTSVHKFYSNVHRQTLTTNVVHLMHQIGSFDYYENDEYQFVKFPFADDADLFVLLALPKTVEHGVIASTNMIHSVLENVRTEYVALAVPRISVEAWYDLQPILQSMGMTAAFDATLAEFDGISQAHDLYLSGAVHKSMLRMDEKGVSATALTMLSTTADSDTETTRPTPILFKADHPFQMFLMDGEHDNVILFVAYITDPGLIDDAEPPVFDEESDPIWNEREEEDVAARNSRVVDLYSLIAIVAAVMAVVVAVCSWHCKRKKQAVDDVRHLSQNQPQPKEMHLEDVKEPAERGLPVTGVDFVR